MSGTDTAHARPHPRTVRLGETSWTIRPLTLRQVEMLEPTVARGSGDSPVSYGLAVLAAALSRDHAADAEGLRDREATGAELSAATREVLILAGYIEETGAGEARAAQGAASTSTSSTDESAPSPAGPSTPLET